MNRNLINIAGVIVMITFAADSIVLVGYLFRYIITSKPFSAFWPCLIILIVCVALSILIGHLDSKIVEMEKRKHAEELRAKLETMGIKKRKGNV